MRFGLQLRSLLFLLALVSACPAFGQAPTITTLPAPRQAVFAGQPLTLTVVATGASPLTYQWRRNGLPIEGATAATYSLTATTPRHTGWYQVVVASATGSTRSAPIHVNVALPQSHIFETTERGSTYSAGTPIRQSPERLTSVSRIVTADAHNLALTHEGTVVGWGYDNYGQASVPGGLTEVVDIASGAYHSLAVRSDGRVVGWGSDAYRQTTVAANLDQVVKVAAGGWHSLALRADGTVVAWGANDQGQCNVPRTLVNVVAIAAGAFHSVALRTDGKIFAWGGNAYGQIEIPSDLGRVVDIAAGENNTFAIRADGSVIGWGYDLADNLKIPQGLDSVVAVAPSLFATFALKSDGTVVSWGHASFGKKPLPAGLTQIAAVGVSRTHAILLRSSSSDERPVILEHPEALQPSPNRNFTLTVTATGHPLYYQWRKDGVAIPEATHATLTRVASQENFGIYDVTITNTKGSAISNPTPVSAGRGPSINSAPYAWPARLGGPLTLQVFATGQGALTYQWYREGGIPIVDATSATYTIARTVATDAGIYYATVTDSRGTITSQDVTVRLSTAPIFEMQPVSVEASPGDTVEFTAETTAYSGTRFEWHKNENIVHQETDRYPTTLKLTNVSLADAGSYGVIARNAIGTAFSDTVTLTFPTLPSIKVPAAQVIATEGTAVTLTCTVASATPVASYQWRLNGVNLTGRGANSTRLDINPVREADGGVYDIVVTNTAGISTGGRTVLVVRARPVILNHPFGPMVLAGQPVSYSVNARHAEHYLWRKDGVPLLDNPTATTANLRISAVTAADVGRYDVIVENSVGHVISSAVSLAIREPEPPSRLANVSILAQLAADEALTVGVVTGGAGTTGDKPLLIRAVGPSLAPLGVQGTLVDPKLEFLRGPTVVSSNDNWGSSPTAALVAAFDDVGAFAYAAPTALDSALHLPTVARGDYSARISSATPAGAGWVLAEIYDSTKAASYTPTTPRLINLSVIKRIDGNLTAGFVIAGTRPVAVLVRAIGPGLGSFGVADFMPDPKIELFHSQRGILATNDNWSGDAALATAFSRSGAFTLPTTSRDAALLRTLEPGAYTVQVSPADGAAGIGLIEIYEVP